MLTTSVSLPVTFASLWRARQHEIMHLAARTLRIQFSRMPLRRGVTRMYNRGAGDFAIVTTRFTEAEYDVLHSAAAAFRVSVSWLVYCIIQMWLKPSRRKQWNPFLTNYVFAPRYLDKNALIFSESTMIFRKQQREKLIPDPNTRT